MGAFNLQYEIKCYAVEICRDITSRRARLEAIREYSEHLEDATYHYMLLGMNENQAFNAACADLGDMSEMQTLLSVTHNRDRLPVWFKYLLVGAGVAILIVAYLFVPFEAVKNWILFLLEACAVAFVGMLLWKSFRYVRAMVKRLVARSSIKKYAKENGCVFLENSSPLGSIFRMSEAPEWVLETEKKRYIISLFPTVERRRVLHFHENGLYTSGALYGFFMKFAYNTLSPSTAAARACELPSGVYRAPRVQYEKHHATGKENVHVLMLNPVPYMVDLCQDNRVKYVYDGDIMTRAYGDAILFSASGFITFLENGERIDKNIGR